MSIKVNLSKKLKGFELDIAFETQGKCTGILGASGCGKSMTLKCIAGLERPDKGEVKLGERILFSKSQKMNVPPQERKVGYLFQNYALFPHMTVEGNIAIGVKESKEKAKRKVNEQIEYFRLNGLEDHYPSQLSGGQQQRVALARILAYNPDVLLLDEPFSALDSFLKDTLAKQLLEVLEKFKGDIMMVSHNRDELYTFCDQLIVMKNGKVLLEGSTKEIFKQPKKMEVAQLTGCKNITAIKRIDSHHLLAIDWNLILTTKQEIGKSIKYVGIRAHEMKPIDQKEMRLNKPSENFFLMEVVSNLEFPFEVDYLIKEKRSNAPRSLCCQLPKSQQLKSREVNIFLPPEALLLLE